MEKKDKSQADVAVKATEAEKNQEISEVSAPNNPNRRKFVGGLGLAGLTAMSAGSLLGSKRAEAYYYGHRPRHPGGPGSPAIAVPRGAGRLPRFPRYNGTWNKVNRRPFGGFDFALGYIAEGVDARDPLQPFTNPSGLFESENPAIPSAVGGNETPARSAEYWYRDIMGWSNRQIAIDAWSFINYARRRWGLDFDNPATDGYVMPDGSVYSYPGSPAHTDEIALFASRIAIDGNGGLVRMAPTLLAPTLGYTVVFKSGQAIPNYVGGTTGVSPEDPAKVRDGGIWGGVLQSIDVLGTIQDVAAGAYTYTTPDGPSNAPAQWGQFWRSIAPIDGLDIDAVNPATAIADRPATRPNWPLGYLRDGTDFFWGNYNLNLGTRYKVVLHYESIMPTRFRDVDGIPEAFICELMAHPGGTDMPADQIAQGFKDLDGSLSGFADFNSPSMNGQNPFGLGRVHGTAVPEGFNEDGLTTYHLRNWLLFPPTLNSVVTLNNTVPGKGVLA